jgi:uncharacterized coiled-coil DUF342 family protein
MDENQQLLVAIRDELKTGFTSLAGRIDETNVRLDVTIERLGSVEHSLNEFKYDVTQRLDGMGKYLTNIDSDFHVHAQRIYKLEQRVDRLEHGV